MILVSGFSVFSHMCSPRVSYRQPLCDPMTYVYAKAVTRTYAIAIQSFLAVTTQGRTSIYLARS
jgi:hypothetical protein